VPEALAEVIEKCLRKEPQNRWRRANDLADALERPKHRLSVLELVTRMGRSAAMLAILTALRGNP
jgi:hypothetical protein